MAGTWHARSTSALVHFLLVLLLVSGLTCLYLWQTSTITSIRYQTATLRARVEEVERENADLMLQVARWHAPSYVEDQARARGLVFSGPPVYVSVVDAAGQIASQSSGDMERSATAGAALWQRITGWLEASDRPLARTPDLAQAMQSPMKTARTP